MRAIRCAFTILSLLPAAAFAQTITSSFQTTSPSGVVSVNIGKSLCQSTRQIDFKVDYTPTGSAPTAGTDTVAFYITPDASTCSDTTKDPASTPNNVSPSQLGQFVISTSYTIGELIAGLPGGCNDTTKSAATPFTVFFCARRKSNTLTGTNVLTNSNSLQVSFALIPPKAPSAPSTVEGDEHLRASWTSNDAGDRTYDAFVVARASNVATPPPTIDVGTVSPVVTGLQQTSVDLSTASDGSTLRDGQTYDVYVRSVDAFGNTSDPSAPGSGTPFVIEDFYRHYRTEGGNAAGGGGCSSGGTGFLAVLGVAAVLLGRRRKAASSVLVASLCAVPAARAADWTGQNRPPRFLLVGLKIDRYDPQIDSEAGLTGRPYHEIFHGRAPARYQLEVDWEAAHPYGSILIGGTIGFWQNYGHGLDPRTTPPTVTSDTTHINIAPVGAVVTYRFDELADTYRWFPVIPYAQAGLMAALWSSYNGRGDVSTGAAAGGRGSGWSYGYTTALGVAVNLDALDAELAREAFIDLGVQRTSAFAEYGWTRLDDFHKRGTLILSDRAWRFGVSLEF